MTSPSTGEELRRRFSLAEIQSATGDFSEARRIGRGGFGSVYKGVVDDGGVAVAMKRLASNSNQGEREFVTELETLTRLRHRNLVSLIGYCNENGEMILVYEYMPKGTLADHLYKHSSNNDVDCIPLTWNQRLKICIGAARGLDYLHTGCSIIHRDVKPSNILLDKNFTAKVSDFGLAKFLSADNSQSHVITDVKGSFGYFDPSYFTSGRLTRQSDTYAFGVVLLEVLSGRPAVGPRVAEGALCLSNSALAKIRNGKADQIVDSNLRRQISEDCLKTFVRVAKSCLDLEPKKRLTMTQIVAQLELALEQQERKGPPRKLQFWPWNVFWNRVIPSGSTQQEVEQTVDEIEEEHDTTSAQQEVEQTVDEIDEEHDTRSAQQEVEQTIDERAEEHDTRSTQQEVEQTVNEIEEEHDTRSTQQEVEQDVNEIEEDQNVNMQPITIHAIPLGELKDITSDFSCDSTIIYEFNGEYIFHGVLRSGQDAAIKKLNKKLPEHEFLAQVSTMSSLKHENVVKLLGYCMESGVQALACEFAPQGSLHNILHGQHNNGFHPLSWTQIIEIAVGAAKGLHYVHDQALIHHNIKSCNVLLFDDEIAKITNIHLPTECPCILAFRDEPLFGELHAGCVYHPPECESRFQTQKGDVYSFGLVLLELLLGDKFYECIYQEEEPDIEPYLWGEISKHSLEAFVDIAEKCVHDEPDQRPTMAEVVMHLMFALEQQQCPKSPGPNELTNNPAVNDHSVLPIAFLFNELQNFNGKFGLQRLIAENSREWVYRGVLKNGQVAAIKKLYYRNQTEKEFLAGVSMVSSLRHENVVQLLGYCVDGGERALAYELAPHGSLHDNLPRSNGTEERGPTLSWAKRVKIAVEAAKGLEYIHVKGEIHGNIKSRNILLFHNGEVAKITDLHVLTQSRNELYDPHDYILTILPCRGYDAPEYSISGQLSWKSDVYSFGVIILELLTGRKPFDHKLPKGEQFLVTWAMPKLKEDVVCECVDPRLEWDYPAKEVAKMAEIAGWCVQYEADSRPQMSLVVRSLQSLLDR